jgi:uncharacterized membrane protein
VPSGLIATDAPGVAPATATLRRRSSRLAGLDVARALAMLGMLIEHSLQYPDLEPKGVLWSVYGRSAPLFVLVAGVGLSLATRPPRAPLSRAMVLARVPFLFLVGAVLSIWVDGVILQSFALFFLVGLCLVRVPRWVLALLAAACLVAGPLYLTVLRRSGEIGSFGSRDDVGFPGLAHPGTLLRGLFLDSYPAVIWLGFFFVGMLIGRAALSSPATARRLFLGGTAASVLLLTIGWAGSRAFGPEPFPFSLAPPFPTTWAEHWTTYGFSLSVGWAVSSCALAVAVVGGSLVLVDLVGRRSRVLAPIVALGAMSLSFYVGQFAYLDTFWLDVKPHLTTTLTYFLASVAFWVVFALAAQLWLRVLPRGPIELLVNGGALALTWPLRAAGLGRPRPAPAATTPPELGGSGTG